MKIATVQMPMALTLADNTSTVLRSLVKAKELGADVAVFPECSTVGFHRGMGEGVSRESIAGVVDQLCAKCAELQINALIGSPYYGTESQEKPWNAILSIDDSGQIAAVSPKIQFTTGEVRHNIMEPATKGSRRTFKLAGYTWVTLICCEVCGEEADTTEYFREILPSLDSKPDIVFIPGILNLGDKNDSHFVKSSIAVAKEYECYVVVANWPEWFLPPNGLGGSFVMNRLGEIVYESPMNEPSITIAELF